jgi:uncharacterized RDD family membrane protein YckC
MHLPPGSMLAHYRIRGKLGSGAMGTVYRAHDTSLERVVAVKVLKPGVAGDPTMVERFFREARAAARVNHANLAHIYFVGSQGDQRFFAMEYVPGSTLEARVNEAGPMPIDDAVDALVQAARGLGAAHAAGVIHRDVKPSNLILRPDGVLKLTDFGLAKSLDADPNLSAEGLATGTPAFMAPEQCRGEPVDARTDVYALGLVGWFLLVGRPPFTGPSLGKVLNDQMNTLLPPVTTERPDASPMLEEALDRMCAKDPARRPTSMAEVVELLEAVRPRTLDRAPLAARVAALGVDLAGLTILWSALALPFSLALRLDVTDTRVGDLVAVSLLALGQLGMEAWHGASPGKMLFHLAVVREDGTRPSLGALAARFVLRFPHAPVAFLTFAWHAARPASIALTAAALLAGAICHLVRGRTLSDFATGTNVVYRLPGSGDARGAAVLAEPPPDPREEDPAGGDAAPEGQRAD